MRDTVNLCKSEDRNPTMAIWSCKIHRDFGVQFFSRVAQDIASLPNTHRIKSLRKRTNDPKMNDLWQSCPISAVDHPQPPNKTVASPQALRARQLASAVHQHEPCRIRPWGCVSARSEKNTLRAHGNEGHNAWRVSYHIVPSFASIVIQIHSKGHKKQGWQS